MDPQTLPKKVPDWFTKEELEELESGVFMQTDLWHRLIIFLLVAIAIGLLAAILH